jgi:ATP-binding cassette subfamily F protein uup
MLTVLAEPNVLLLDEPTNDVDTDMLAATEDLLDSWPGTLIVVSHDRYLLERVTDQQYGILNGRLRHLPGGIDEYLRLASEATAERTAATAVRPSESQQISGAELRAAEKELGAIDRRLARLADQIAAKHTELAEHDQSDHVGIARLTEQLRDLEGGVTELENRWMEVSEIIE